MNSSLSPERKSEITLTNITMTDCGVIALQAVTGLKRARAEAVAIDQAGYRPGHGVTRGGLNRALEKMGWKVDLVATERDRFTVATFAMDHEYGTYLLYTEQHVMAMIDGDVHNSKGTWRAPLEEAYKLTRS